MTSSFSRCQPAMGLRSRFAVLGFSLLLMACTREGPVPPPDFDPYDVTIGPYEVDIRRTGWGVPHIKADDYGSLAYGMGYALAQDHLCSFADQLLKIRSERARYFGPGEDDSHLNSDFGWLALGLMEQAEEGFSTLPDDLQNALVGYSAGVNRLIDETGPDNYPIPCRNADWVQPTNHIELLAYYLHLGQFGSGYPFVDLIATAQAPGRRAGAPPGSLDALDYLRHPPMGSNGWALGSERSEGGKGMLVSNTHFPAEGERQWHESHLTIPGVLNVYGASLIGSALINIGFNEHVAWTHTVSNTPRFVVYQHELQSGNSTRYKYGSEWRDMASRVYSIEVLQDDGSLDTVDRTLYRTHYGPVINAPIVGWSSSLAFSYRDVNENNLDLARTFFGMNHAKSLEEFQAAQRDYQGIPWVHTMAADASGKVFYADSANTPNLSPEAESAYLDFKESNSLAALFSSYGIWLVDGADSVFEWVDDPRSVRPGAIPFDDMPQLLRDDFVSNANENAWLANPHSPITEMPLIFGETGNPLTPRTRMNNLHLLSEGPDSASGEDGRFSLNELEAVLMGAEASLAHLLRAQVVERCTGHAEVSIEVGGDTQTVDITAACEVLADWDGRANVQSVGTVLWREFVGSDSYSYGDLRDAGDLFEVGFDPSDPVFTPHTLTSKVGDTDPVLENLARAVRMLESVGLEPSAPLGDVQYRKKGDLRISSPGTTYLEGSMSIASWEEGANSTLLPPVERGEVVHSRTGLTEEGYVINAGNSWMMVMEFTDTGPKARAVMTYSGSEDPESPHFVDQSELYASELLRAIQFTESDIESDWALTEEHLSHPG